jgi:hypothetical protein
MHRGAWRTGSWYLLVANSDWLCLPLRFANVIDERLGGALASVLFSMIAGPS